jgi:hypothetical protein
MGAKARMLRMMSMLLVMPSDCSNLSNRLDSSKKKICTCREEQRYRSEAHVVSSK